MIDFLNDEQQKMWGMKWGLPDDKVICKKCKKTFVHNPESVNFPYFIDPKDPGGIVTCKECIEEK